VSAANREGVTPLQLPRSTQCRMTREARQAGADPNAPVSASGDTALMLAARTGTTDAIKILLEPART